MYAAADLQSSVGRWDHNTKTVWERPRWSIFSPGNLGRPGGRPRGHSNVQGDEYVGLRPSTALLDRLQQVFVYRLESMGSMSWKPSMQCMRDEPGVFAMGGNFVPLTQWLWPNVH